MRTNTLVASMGVAAAAGWAAAGPVQVNYQRPTLDRWMYPFNSTPGSRPEASTFASLNLAGFDDRDAEFLVGFDTGPDVTPGQGPASYVVISARVRATISEGGRFVYDPTFDSVSTSYDPTNPAYTPDLDPGKPIEVFGCGYRNGYGAVTTPTTQEFCESCPFGGAPMVPPAEGARNVFPAIFDSVGTPTDVSRQVRLQFEATPMAVGQTTAVAPGELVPAGAEFVFDIDLCNPATRAYFQRSLDLGRVDLLITSLHPVTGPTSVEYPVFYTKENPLAATNPAVVAHLELVVNRGPRSDYNNDNQLNVNDFVAYLAGFAAGDRAADVNDDCALNVNDFVTFLGLFAAGR
jgi:hypothetical protein